MKAWRVMRKKLLAMTLTASLIGSSVWMPKMTVLAAPEEDSNSGQVICATSGKWVDLGNTNTSSAGISLFSVMGRSVSGAEKWIDRVDLPDYADALYVTLVEATDADGTDDVLIDAAGFSEENAITVEYSDNTKDIFNGILVREITTSEQLTDDEEAEMQNNIRIAFEAFDRDYPEVFWLSGKTQCLWVISGSTSGGVTSYTYELYLVCKDHVDDFDMRATNYATEEAITAAIATRDTQVSTICGAAAGSDYEKIKYFNQWLTSNNEYNTAALTDEASYPEAWQCMSALDGVTTTNPVCEGYARAFKVLCDNAGISCVLVDGDAKSSASDAGEAHMWNYVQLENAWYAVDVTWNDPTVTDGSGNIVDNSAYVEDWLLLGSESEIETGFTFLESHPVSNAPSATSAGVGFVNGPTLSTTKYVMAEAASVSLSQAEVTLEYGAAVENNMPTVTVTVGDESFTPAASDVTYSYKTSEDEAYTVGLPSDAGSYTIKVQAAAGTTSGGVKYTAAENTFNLTITKKEMSVVYPMVSDAVTYGTKLGDCTLTGGDTTYGSFAWSEPEAVLTVGAQTAEVIFIPNEAAEKNYTITNTAEMVSVTVNQSTPVVGVSAENDGTVISVEVTVTGAENGQAPSGEVKLVVDGVEAEAVALDNGKASVEYEALERRTYNIQVTYAGDTNYTSAESAQCTVDTSKKNQTGFVIDSVGEKTYGDEDFVLTTTGGESTGEVSFVSSNPAAVTVVTGGYVTIKKAGEVIITATKAGDDNYNQTEAQIVLKVAKKDLTIAAEDKTVVAGAELPELTYTVTGLVNGDEITTQPVCSAETAKLDVAGEYAIEISGAVVENQDSYNIVYQAGTLTVEAATEGDDDTTEDDNGSEDKDNPNDDSSSDSDSSDDGNNSDDSSSSDDNDNAGDADDESSETGSASSSESSSVSASSSDSKEQEKVDTIVMDSQKGKVDVNKGIIVGTTNGNAGDGYSHWKSDNNGWWLQYADGTYAAGSIVTREDGSVYENVAWEKINDQWFCFGADGYAKSGWVNDGPANVWYYVDINAGMLTGWLFVGDVWYYMNPINGDMAIGWKEVAGKWYYLAADGACLMNTVTPDGYMVDASGAWVQ